MGHLWRRGTEICSISQENCCIPMETMSCADVSDTTGKPDLLQDILSGGHHVFSPECTISELASLLPAKADEDMQWVYGCHMQNAVC